MASRLDSDVTKVCWRIRAEDAELLRTLFPARVNEVVREVITDFCDALRAQRGERGEG